MKNKLKYLLLTCLLLLGLFLPAVRAKAVTTDEIKKFIITVDVNEDASLEMNYYIEWEVLDDEEYGPLEWMDIGVPNDHHENIRALSDTIDHIEDTGDTFAIYLDRLYYAGETAAVEFSFTQDYMYQIDKYTAGETVYSFTPAWFGGIDIDELQIRWNAENVGAFQPDCLKDSGYLVFRASVPAGETYTIEITYPGTSFGFSPERQTGGSGSGNSGGYPDVIIDPEPPTIGERFEDMVTKLLGASFALAFFAGPVVLIVLFVRWIRRGTGFGTQEETKKKITRTKIEYFANCPSCGAVRVEGKDSCPYCGRSMIKSKEIVEESQIEKPENYSREGTYRYGNSPNTYIHVHVVNIPVHHSSSTRSSSSSSSHRSSCACASSCAHSCACASSCACACACASSGRAGCSIKDFFRRACIRAGSG